MTTWIDDWNPGLAESDQSFLFLLTIGQHFTGLKWLFSCREKPLLADAREEADRLRCQALVRWHAAGGPQSSGPSVTRRAEPDRAERSRARDLQFVSMVACARASLGLICGPNGTRQEVRESKCTAAAADDDRAGGTAERRADRQPWGAGDQEWEGGREEAALGSWQ